uniref:Protein TIC 214 n=1 Tax=Azima tetracantha TaxID=43153 RepID=A0A4Y5PTN5_9ROSI|nr:Ycf1 protein [Azima tetracantha]QCW95451.1 Ycf1 protein [Azima tetracantha]
MIFQSFILGNLVSLCMKIINSVVVVGLYCGFLTTFSIGPSYLFLLRARVMEEGEEGTEKKVSATTGFIAGQLMMFISIYYAPMHLALGRPHTITVLALPYLLFHFFWNNHKHFFDYGSTSRNSIRNLRIQCVFLNNLIFQLFNHFILPSSMLTRLVNIYLFRCNNKMLFVTSSFVGWLIGHILFIKWVGLVLVWIQQNNSIRSNALIRSNKYKYLVSELRNSMARIFSILLFITCVYYLGRIPSPIFTKKLKGTSEKQEGRGTKQDHQEVSIEEDPDKIDKTEEIRVNEKEKNQFLKDHEKNIVSLLFDFKKTCKRPIRYIKDGRAIKTEMSQYFFYICQSDRKEIISFTYPPPLSTFFEMIDKKIPFLTKKKLYWTQVSTFINENEQRGRDLTNEFLNRIETLDLDKGSISFNMLQKKARLCKNETEKEYLPKIYDPVLHGASRGRIKNSLLLPRPTETYKRKYIAISWINKIHNILDEYQFYERIDKLNKKSLSIKNKLSFFSEQEEKIDSENQIKILKNFLFNAVLTDSNDQTFRKSSIGINEIVKKVPFSSPKLITDLQHLKRKNREDMITRPEIRSRKGKRVVILNINQNQKDIPPNTKNSGNYDKKGQVALIRYSKQPNFRRNLIKGSIRAQRRKTIIGEFFQANPHSPLFFDRMGKFFFFSFDIFALMKEIFRNWTWKNKKINYDSSDYMEEKTKKIDIEKEEKRRMKIAETWDSFLLAQVIRSCVLITQSFLRKYILFPFLIIVKNIARILLFQPPEWSEDLKDWKREIHIKCTYNGIQLSETEFPKNWLIEGIQIKILFPFCLKPWHNSKLRASHKNGMKKKREQKNDFCFLTVWGIEVDHPFGSARKKKNPSFFKPILKEFEKKIRKWKTKSFRVLRVLKQRENFFLEVLNERKKGVVKKLVFLKGKINKFLKRISISLFGFRKTHEFNEIKKDLIINNQMIHESSIQIQPMEWTNYSLREKKMKNLISRTKTIKNQIEEITKEKKNKFLTQEKKSSSNKTNFFNKILEPSKNIFQISKRKNTRFIRKLYSKKKIFIEKVYIDIFLSIINIPRINTQLFVQSIKKIININKDIYNPKINEQRINKTNKNTIHFISTIENIPLNIRKRNKNSTISHDLFFVSQAYVFFKLSQIQVINLYKLRSVLQYYETSFFLKNKLKSFFEEQGTLYYDYELKEKNRLNCEINEWKNWLRLRSYFQYDLSQITWSRLVTKKWRNRIQQENRINQDCIFQNKHLNKRGSHEQDPFLSYEKPNHFLVDQLLNHKQNFIKNSKYNLLSYKSINSKDKIFYNYNIDKGKFFDMSVGIPMNNYLFSNFLSQYNIRGMDQIPDRKYLDWRILNFCFQKKMDIELWLNIDTKNNKNIKQNYQIINKITTKKGATNQKRNFFDWMGMNEESLSCPMASLKFCFFPEFVLLSNVYKMKPWIIPIKLLLFNFNKINKDITTNRNKKDFLSLDKKESLSFELENPNKEENKYEVQAELESDEQKEESLESVLSKQEKNIKEDYKKSDIKKHMMKKQYKSNTEAELDFFLKKYLRFQLRWNEFLNQKVLNNMKVYSLLIRLINQKEILISSIQKGEINLDLMIIEKDLSFTIPELIKKGILIVEPVRLSLKNDGYFIIYRTIGISLVHKNKYQINERYKQKSYILKNYFDESTKRHQKLTRNRDKSYYDLFVPENILYPKQRREFRILICFNSKNLIASYKNLRFDTKVKNSSEVLNKTKDLDRDKNNLIKLKLFLWPNFRLEDLACMNRYWFNTSNGSRFSMLRIHMYPRLKMS